MKKVRKWHLTVLTFFIFCNNIAYSNPQDTVRQHLQKRISAIVDQFYYTNPDSAFYLLQKIENIASKNKIADIHLSVLLSKGWIAEHHRQIDSLYSCIQKGNKVLSLHRTEIERLDSDHSLYLDFMYMKGMYHYIVGDFSSSLSDFKKVIFQDNHLVVKDSLEAFDALCNIGQLYSSLQDHAQSLYYYGMAEQILPKKYPTYATSARDYNYQLAFMDVSIAKTLSAKKKSTGLQNKQTEIIKTYRGALLKLKGKEKRPEAQNLFLTIYHNLGEVYIAENKIDSAIYWVKKSLKIIKKGDPEINIKTLTVAGRTHREAGLYDQAQVYFQKAMVIAKKEYINHHHFKASIFYEQGQLAFSKKNWTEALFHYQQALKQVTGTEDDNFYNLPINNQSNSENELLKIVMAKAETFYAWYKSLPHDKNKLIVAIAHYEFAVTCADEMKQTIQQEESQQTFSSSLHSIYEKGILATYDAYEAGLGSTYLEKSFYFLEKNKASSLLRATRGIAAQNITSIPTSILTEENFLKGKLYYWQHQLEKATEPVEIQAIQAKILNIYEACHTLMNNIKKNYPSYYSLKYNMQVTSFKQVREKLLTNDNVILEYYYGEKNLYIFLLSKSGTALKKIPIGDEFNVHFNNLLNQLKDGPTVKSNNNSKITTSAHILYQYLVEPIHEKIPLKTKKLLIIPSGILGYLPFEILLPQEPNNKNENIVDLPYLFKKFTIGYEHSSTLALEKKERPSSNQRYAYLGFAPSYGESRITNPELASRGSEEKSLKDMPSLNFNQQEIENASKHFFKSTNFYGPNATEGSFKNYGTQSKIIHLSMHAILNDRNSLYSGLQFSTNKNNIISDSTKDEDGFLYLYELYNLKLQADLAVLSACETGIGELSPGEGVISMGRAFQYAGCPAVAMSLWQVNDRSTSSLMKLFFENLSDGMAKDEALQQAKISFLQDSKNKHFLHPHYWSAFILVGNETALNFYPFYNLATLIVFCIILTDMIIILSTRKEKRGLPL